MSKSTGYRESEGVGGLFVEVGQPGVMQNVWFCVEGFIFIPPSKNMQAEMNRD